MRTTSQILDALRSAGSDGGSLPDALCSDCTAVLTLSGVSMSLVDEAGGHTVAGASGPLASRMDQAQFDVGEGPCVDAATEGRPALHSHALRSAATLWPAFGAVLVDAGVQAVFAFPLQVGAVRLGSLGLYRATTGPLGADGTSTALAYADAAVVVLLDLQARAGPGVLLHPDLEAPVSYRAEVHQATGFLAVQASVGLAEALLLLRAQAFSSDRPLLLVAREVLSGRLRIDVGGGHGQELPERGSEDREDG